MPIHRDDFKEVKPTPEEIAQWKKKHPNRGLPYRAEHLPCGTRIWYSGISIGAHVKACVPTKREEN